MKKTHKANEGGSKTLCGFTFKSIREQHAACVASWTDSNLCKNCLRYMPAAPNKPHRWWAIDEHRLYCCQVCGLRSRSRNMHSEFDGLGTECPGPKTLKRAKRAEVWVGFTKRPAASQS